MKQIFLLLLLISGEVLAQNRRVSDEERWSSIMEGRRRMREEAARCTQHPDAVRRNLNNFVRQLGAPRNLNLPRYCMDMNQRRQYREIFRNDPAFRAAADAAAGEFRRRHPLPDIRHRIECSRRNTMRVRTPTSMLGGVRG